MQRLTAEELVASVADYDAAVERDVSLDPFCARSAWCLSYHEAFAPDRPLLAAREGDSWVLLAYRQGSSIGTYLEPLENMWGFASPLVGDDAAALLGILLAERPMPAVLLAQPRDAGRLDRLGSALSGQWIVRPVGQTVRYVASLEGGYDGWLSRRSRSFRRSMRAAEKRTQEAGISFERRTEVPAQEALAAYARVLAVETRSWKGQSGSGADRDPMRSFYARMWQRLAPAGQLELLFARCGDRDVGYLHGARIGTHFRGLQFSYDAHYENVGLGNALQLEMLRSLCATGARHYDLGSTSVYKRRWAEEGMTTVDLLVRPVP